METAPFVRVVSGAASRCDMHALKTDRAARGIFGASRKQRRSCGHAKFEWAIAGRPGVIGLGFARLR
ncbi:hypothetical protein CAMGR0001_0927 [Campylobacter gracilis RM3268]|uniref:Uncharacterized protein n=1 Tax=Campylobacter gracilis RM3268 TaxID=553220 RepID=C8PGD4_9BACT|nr:hypothetical protein CAMGR0001_0927 [Campylobacter gracilis RM3268]